MFHLPKPVRALLIAVGVLSLLNTIYDRLNWMPLQRSRTEMERNIQSLRESAREYHATDLNYGWTVDEAASSVHRSRVAKVSMLYGNTIPIYERAMALNSPHNDRFGYPHFVLRSQTLPGFWSKPGFILQLLLSELSKPEDDRLQWLFWLDADTVIMNPKIPLEIFLPPSDSESETDWSHIHAVVTNDHKGLNNGVFFLRVHPWAVDLMTATLSTPITRPELELEFHDQTALMYWANQPRFSHHIMHVPQRWFNAYPGWRGSASSEDDAQSFSDPLQPPIPGMERRNAIREGDLLVHHAGHRSQRSERMRPWVNAAEQHLPAWELEPDQTTYLEEIASFWANDAQNERERNERFNQKLEAAKQLKG